MKNIFLLIIGLILIPRLDASDISFLNKFNGDWYGTTYDEYQDVKRYYSYPTYVGYSIETHLDSVLLMRTFRYDKPFYGSNGRLVFESFDQVPNYEDLDWLFYNFFDIIYIYDEKLKLFIGYDNWDLRVLWFAFADSQNLKFTCSQILKVPGNFFNIKEKTGSVAQKKEFSLSELNNYLSLKYSGFIVNSNTIKSKLEPKLNAETLYVFKRVNGFLNPLLRDKFNAISRIISSSSYPFAYPPPDLSIQYTDFFHGIKEAEDPVLISALKFNSYSKSLFGRWKITEYDNDVADLPIGEVLCFPDRLGNACFKFPEKRFDEFYSEENLKREVTIYTLGRLDYQMTKDGEWQLSMQTPKSYIEKTGDILSIVYRKDHPDLREKFLAPGSVLDSSDEAFVLLNETKDRKWEFSKDSKSIKYFELNGDNWILKISMERSENN